VLEPLPRRRAGARPALILLALAGLVALAGCDASEDADLERGRALFQAKCGTCHALAQAGTSTEIGPDLDAAFAQPRADGMDNDTIEGVVQGQIDNPREINIPEDDPQYTRVFMPPDLVTGQDAEDVAAYVASVAGVPGAEAPKLPPDQLFTEQCGSCHALGAAGTAGETGPNLDETLAGKPAGYIETQIVDPNSEIAEGFGPDIMPQDYEQTLAPDELEGLVEYLLENAGRSQGSG
jgi:mono/diheme cytochrome c family protein